MTNGYYKLTVCSKINNGLGSRVYIIGEPLINVIMACGIAVDSCLYDSFYPVHEFLISGPFMKSASQRFSIKLLEAFHIFTVRHHFYPFHDISLVVANKLECEEEEVLEVQKDIWVYPVHELNVIFRQFERRLFEPEVPRRTTDNKAEVYVDYVPAVVD